MPSALATLPLGAEGRSGDREAIRAARQASQRNIAVQNFNENIALHTPYAIVMFANAPVA